MRFNNAPTPSRLARRRLASVLPLALTFAAVGACGGGGTSSSDYTVGGSVTGLVGAGLVLEDNGGDALTVSAGGTFVFSSSLANGAAYSVAVQTQPSGETCSVSGGSGTVSSANVTDVLVDCTTNIAAAGPNVTPVIVDSGPAALPAADADANTPFITVTICAPGTSNCQSIDHVIVDTGSYGLRILSSALSSSLYGALPQVTQSATNEPLAECAGFADGYSWGPIKSADLQISSESASSLEVQLIGDPAYPTVPSDCADTGPQEDTLDSFGANGILGIGPLVQDCGSGCTAGPQTASYYVCPSSTSCTDATAALAQQVSNPIVFFATDNNGSIVELPEIGPSGAATVTGALVFGIGTEGNNGLGSATVFTLDPSDGDLTTQFNGQSLTQSFLDSGSEGFFFNDSSIPQCSDDSGIYCPSGTLSLQATNVGINAVSSTVSFSIANADQLSGSLTAFDDLGGANILPDSFDWGLPFFFGRDVYTAIDGQNTAAGVGPYAAY